MDLTKLANVDLIQELGLDSLPKEEREELLLEIGEVVQQRIVLRLVEEMPEDVKSEFNRILDESEKNNTPEMVGEFLREKFPDIDKIAVEEIGQYKGEILDLMKGMEKDI